MAWFLNHYQCDRCAAAWEDDWSCMCDDDCPECGLTMSPEDSDDLTFLVEQYDGKFFILQSSAEADYDPAYRLFPRAFRSREHAAEVVENRRRFLGV